MPAVQAPVGVLHYVPDTIHKAHKALVAAKFNGIVLTQQTFDPAKDAKKPVFTESNPLGKLPFLQTDTGCIATSNAIARYVARCRADTSLYGKCFDDEGQIDTLMEFATYEIEIPLAVWLYPVLGLMAAPDAAKTESAKNDIKNALKSLEDRLKTSPFLVGDFVSLADIVVVCALREGFARLFDPAFRKPYAKVCAWFELCCAMPQFSSVIGPVSLCTKAEQPKAVKAAPAQKDAKADKKPEAKKEAAPKAKAEPKAAATLTPEQDAAAKAIGEQIRDLKAKLKGDGVTGKKLNDHPEIVALVAKMDAIKAGGAPPASQAAPKAKAEPKAKAGASGFTPEQEEAIKAIGEEIREVKNKLKEQGITGKKLNEHPEIIAMVAKLDAAKAGAPPASKEAPAAKKEAKEKPKAEAKKEGKKGAPKAEEKKELSPEELKKEKEKKLKKVVKEGGKRGVEIDGAADMGGLQFFCTSVEEPDGDMELLGVCLDAMNAESDPSEEERKGGSGRIGKMIFSAGTDQLAVIAYVPQALASGIKTKEWLEKVLALFGGEVVSFDEGKDAKACGVIKADSDKGKFPMKMKEPCITEAIAYLKAKGLFPDKDDDSDEMVFGDDDFPA